MERNEPIKGKRLLIEPFGIETVCARGLAFVMMQLLIEPFGIETDGHGHRNGLS